MPAVDTQLIFKVVIISRTRVSLTTVYLVTNPAVPHEAPFKKGVSPMLSLKNSSIACTDPSNAKYFLSS